MAGDPIVDAGFPASTEKAEKNPGLEKIGRKIFPNDSFARQRRRWQRHRRHGPRSGDLAETGLGLSRSEAPHRATWCGSPREENLVQPECDGKGPHWS